MNQLRDHASFLDLPDDPVPVSRRFYCNGAPALELLEKLADCSWPMLDARLVPSATVITQTDAKLYRL
jgi:hypothetical protein